VRLRGEERLKPRPGDYRQWAYTRSIDMPVFTIGHSSIPQSALIGLLEKANVKFLADVRTNPYSGANPQYNKDPISSALKEQGIEYQNFPQLGGKDPGIFRNIKTDEGVSALDTLCELAKTTNICIMCAEADWNECHRQVVATEVQKRGFPVTHLKRDGASEKHPEEIQYPPWLLESQHGDGIDRMKHLSTIPAPELQAKEEKKKTRWKRKEVPEN